jgi:predicted component of type VI protein secretion system
MIEARDPSEGAPMLYPVSFRVATAGRELLRTRTKDLRLGAIVAEAELGLPGSDGLARGLALLAGLMERYWDSMFPQPDAMEGRVAALAWFVDRARRRFGSPDAPQRADATLTAMDRFDLAVRQHVPDPTLRASVDALRDLVERAPTEFALLDDLLNQADAVAGHQDYDLVKMYGAPPLFDSIRERLSTWRGDDSRIVQKIAEIDAQLSAQLNEILHHPKLQRLEATWRAVWHVVERVEASDRVELEVLQVTKSELFDDLLRGAAASRLHDIVHDGPYLRGAAAPYGLLVGDFTFGPDDADVALLERVATLAAKVHAPFLAGTSPAMFELDTWRELPTWLHERFRVPMTQVPEVIDGAAHIRWRAFRELDEAAYVGLCLPRFMLRPPYGAEASPLRRLAFVEDVCDPTTCFLWGNVAFALAARAARSFARFAWCANIIGPEGGGALEGLASNLVSPSRFKGRIDVPFPEA